MDNGKIIAALSIAGAGLVLSGKAGAFSFPGGSARTNFTVNEIEQAEDNDHAELIQMTTPDTPLSIEAVDWSQVRWFTPGEFYGHADDMNPAVIYAADELREKSGCKLKVSPAPGATARFNGNTNSQHYAVNRLSTALDLMPEGCALKELYDLALTIPAIGGIGLYPDWKPSPGIHLDTRKRINNQVATWQGRKKIGGGQEYAAIDFNLPNYYEVIS